MDIECTNLPSFIHASEDDLQTVLAADFGPTLMLVRNYGDRLEAIEAGSGWYRLAYYDASSGKRHEAAEPASIDQVKDAIVDYFEGRWNWHGWHQWRTR